MSTTNIARDGAFFAELAWWIAAIEGDIWLAAREVGREEGIDIKAIMIAEKMLKRGVAIEDIVELTELPPEKVVELKKKFV